jgi:hypothetical protein
MCGADGSAMWPGRSVGVQRGVPRRSKLGMNRSCNEFVASPKLLFVLSAPGAVASLGRVGQARQAPAPDEHPVPMQYP